ncbi:MAG: tRNA (uridine(34)/cytosine(34)/5-carboxymethylaminomethyluridine(34)-2'-O)-methyltransferase TrmL [Sideroxydans sp. RIFOXYB12_FULL_59_6]|nr:MAG: tRNA (uridine(34)/cytosine(34)/5-carboxymethylaminomethyluridine(34)-2'-O)-methyltransferase TrmL [Sideroxydans sp. RIFOXYB12_FULL_59_6]
MFNIILFQPEIPPNTGNIIRLCANTGSQLHLIRPLGFDLDDKHLRRAGLDYHEYASVRVYDTLVECLDTLPKQSVRRESPNTDHRTEHLPHSKLPPTAEEPNASLAELADTCRVFAFTTKASHPYHEVQFQRGDAFLFGPESRGLPPEVLAAFVPERRLRLPMLPDNRSLNLSNTVAVTVFEAWRQCGFDGAGLGN